MTAPALVAPAGRPRRPLRVRALRVTRRGLLYAILIAGGLLMMVPFFWMIVTSLKTRAEVFGASPLSLPSGAHFENYANMWNAFPQGVTFGTFFGNSLKLALLCTAGQLVTSSMAAYAFAVIPFRGRGPLFGILLATLIIPVPGRPGSRTSSSTGACRTRSAPAATGSGPRSRCGSGRWLGGAFGTFLLRQFFLAIPRELADAARVDGANPWQIFTRIYLPLARPALATLAIFTFMWTWNDLLNPLIYLSDLDQYTTTVGLAVLPGPVRRASGRR